MRETKDCFKGENIYYRDSDLDTWLPKEQKELEIGNVSNFEMGMTFLQACQKYANTVDKKELLKYAFTLPQIEEMIKDPESHQLRTNVWSNLFLVESNDGVSVVRVTRDDGQWHVYVYRLDHAPVWDVAHRFFFRNLTLGHSKTLTLENAVKICKKAGYVIYQPL